MTFQKRNKKKILQIGIALVVCVCFIGGGTLFAMKKSEKAVKVAPVASMSNGGWYSESDIYDYAKVQAGASQDIYHDDTLTIKEIYVKSGDTVKIGDRLVAYDTTLAGLEQEMKQMEIQGIELNIQNQKAELEQLKNAKIVASVERSQDELRKMTAKGTRPGIIRTADENKNEGENPDTSENPEQPETPEEPKIPDEPDNPGGYEEPDPGEADGMTREEQAKQIQEKEQKIKDLDLEKRTAQLELKKLDKKVNNGVVKSTVEGTVKTVLDEEEAKLENKPVISVTGKNGCYVIGGIAESSYDKLKEGMTVMVTSWNTGNSYEATITSIGNSPVESMKSSENPNMSYYAFTAVVEKDADLSSGEGVSISVDGLSGDSGNSIYLEQMFIREDGNRSYVYKKGKHGRLEKQYVEVGKNMYGSIEIVSGLTMEDEIAFPYGRNVKEGAKTKTVESLYDYN